MQEQQRIRTDLTMATCPTTSFSTTSAPTTSKPMATTARASTNTSRDDYVDEAGRNTSTLVGGATTKPPGQQTMKQTTLQTSLKRRTESASSSDSNSSAASTSSKSVNTRNKKKHKSARPPLEPTEEHMEIRAVADAAIQWELDLETVHGLMDEEACAVVAIALKHLPRDEFPSLNGNPSYIKLAKEGWELLKEANRVQNLHPQCTNQAKVDGVWKMFRE